MQRHLAHEQVEQVPVLVDRADVQQAVDLLVVLLVLPLVALLLQQTLRDDSLLDQVLGDILFLGGFAQGEREGRKSN